MSFCNVQCELHVASKLSSNCMTNRLRDLFQDTLSKFPTPCCPLELEVTAKCSEEEYRWNKLPCQSSILRSIIHTYIIHIYLNTGLYRYVICILYVYKQWKKIPAVLDYLIAYFSMETGVLPVICPLKATHDGDCLENPSHHPLTPGLPQVSSQWTHHLDFHGHDQLILVGS